MFVPWFSSAKRALRSSLPSSPPEGAGASSKPGGGGGGGGGGGPPLGAAGAPDSKVDTSTPWGQRNGHRFHQQLIIIIIFNDL